MTMLISGTSKRARIWYPSPFESTATLPTAAALEIADATTLDLDTQGRITQISPGKRQPLI